MLLIFVVLTTGILDKNRCYCNCARCCQCRSCLAKETLSCTWKHGHFEWVNGPVLPNVKASFFFMEERDFWFKALLQSSNCCDCLVNLALKMVKWSLYIDSKRHQWIASREQWFDSSFFKVSLHGVCFCHVDLCTKMDIWGEFAGNWAFEVSFHTSQLSCVWGVENKWGDDW